MTDSSYPDLPAAFSQRVSEQLEDPSQFFVQLNKDANTFIRVHPVKQKFVKSPLEGIPVNWNSDGLMLSERPSFSRMPEYHSGLIYPMESSSMFLEYVLNHIHLEPEDIILDLCGAPGGKTLILKDHYPYNLLLSNETDQKRSHILKENSIRWGTDDHIVIHSDAEKIAASGIKCNLILVDAPCSGEGLFRKDKQSRIEWSEQKAAGCAIRQQQILNDIGPVLAPGGTLIYSTCTFNPAENMEQVVRHGNEFGLESVVLNIPSGWNIEELTQNGYIGYQFWPHRVAGEGFFISVLKDPREHKAVSETSARIKEVTIDLPGGLDFSEFWIQEFDGRFYALTTSEIVQIQRLQKFGTILKRGLFLGEMRGRDFIPSYDLAMHPKGYDFNPRIELDKETAIKYLQGQALSSEYPSGPVLLTYNNLNLGFGKSNQQRINNQYPKHLRLPSTI